MQTHPQAFSDESFWKKLRRFARKAGSEVVERALVLYYCLRDPDTPAWARAVIVGALGYFILPMDLIPDVVPLTGFADDFGTLVGALVSVARHVKPQHRAMAAENLARWFGSLSEDETRAPT